MRKKEFILFIVAMIFLGSCNSSKQSFVNRGNTQDDAIYIAMSDFSKIDKLFKKGSVFSVEISGLSNSKDLMVVRIGKNNKKLLLTKETKVGSLGKLPSRYFEKDGKLFFWWDDSYPLKEDALIVFKKYNLLQDDSDGAILIPDFIIDDAQKAAHYYICKNNITLYKKIITSKGIGYYSPPQLNCISIK